MQPKFEESGVRAIGARDRTRLPDNNGLFGIFRGRLYRIPIRPRDLDLFQPSLFVGFIPPFGYLVE